MRFMLAMLLASTACVARAAPMADVTAWNAARQMGIGINIGNTLERRRASNG